MDLDLKELMSNIQANTTGVPFFSITAGCYGISGVICMAFPGRCQGKSCTFEIGQTFREFRQFSCYHNSSSFVRQNSHLPKHKWLWYVE